MSFEVTVEKDETRGAARRMGDLLDRAVRKVAFDIEREAKEAAPVDTGALRASIHTVTWQDDGYAAAASAAVAADPHAQVFPGVRPDGPHEAVVAVAAAHGAFVEMGTVRQAAQPFFRPAVEANRKKLAAAVAAAVRQALKG
jgi:HK97 gp10 family phage protein